MTTSPPRLPWGKVALVLAVIGGAHVAFFLLLTSSARADRAALENRWGVAKLATAEEPGPRPAANREVPTWLRSQSLWEDARTWGDRRTFIRGLGLGLAGSFLLQTGLLAVVLHRSVSRSARSRGSARARRS